MRRMCFDTESNAFQSHNTSMREDVEFHAGCVYEEAIDTYYKFGRAQANEMLGLLLSADQLIAQHARWDIEVLERSTKNKGTALWSIPIWDIAHFEPRYQTLDDRTLACLPELGASMKLDYDTERAAIDTQYPGSPWGVGTWRPNAYFDCDKLAKAVYDVRRTYAVWKVLTDRDPTLRPCNLTLRNGA